MSEVTLTAKQIKNFGLWDKVCKYKGWDEHISAERVDENELITFDDSFQKESVVEKIEKVLVLNKDESISILDIVQDAIERGMITTQYDIDRIEDFMNRHSDAFENWKFDNVQITIEVNPK